MILPIENQTENRLHGFDGDSLFLGALHVEDMMLYAVLIDERLIAVWEVLLDQCSKMVR